MEQAQKKEPYEKTPAVTTEETGVNLGEQLRTQRKARGISMVEVAEHTKIGKRYLEALEEGHFELIPGETYIRGFIRAYAKYLELDEKSLLDQYQRQRLAVKGNEERQRESEEQERKNNQSIWIPLITIMVLAGFGAGLFLLWPTVQREPEPVQEAPVNEMMETEFDNASPNEAAVVIPAGEMTLKVRAKEKTWITIMADGRQEPDAMLNPGQERVWQAKDRFVLWTGNAGGIEVYFNGKLQPPLGAVGEVVKEVVFERPAPVANPTTE